MTKGDRILRIIMSIVLPVAMFFLAKEAAVVKAEFVKSEKKECIVIDVGHGGRDPGKVGVTGCLEKDINLQIAYKLKSFLEMEDYEVFLTRTGDEGLYGKNDQNKKRADMEKRVRFIEEKSPILTISIHQNSYSGENVKGAQSFYFSGSQESQELAKTIQASLVNTLDKSNRRREKANDNYYMLKNTSCPIVIVECGFLSNTEECKKLETDYYQEKVAWAIYMGTMQYVNKQ